MATKKSVIAQLQSVSEGAIEMLTHSGPTRSAIQGATQLKDRGGRLLHGLESIEERLSAIEKRLAALEGGKPKAATTRPRSATTKARPETKSEPAK